MAIERGLRKAGSAIEIDIAYDGQQALSHLQKLAQHDALPPIIITLDLNMPRMSGLEFLAILRADACLRRLPVFVFGTSDAKADVQAAYALNAVGYVVKDSSPASLAAAFGMLATFAEVCELPR